MTSSGVAFSIFGSRLPPSRRRNRERHRFIFPHSQCFFILPQIVSCMRHSFLSRPSNDSSLLHFVLTLVIYRKICVLMTLVQCLSLFLFPFSLSRCMFFVLHSNHRLFFDDLHRYKCPSVSFISIDRTLKETNRISILLIKTVSNRKQWQQQQQVPLKV